VPFGTCLTYFPDGRHLAPTDERRCRLPITSTARPMPFVMRLRCRRVPLPNAGVLLQHTPLPACAASPCFGARRLNVQRSLHSLRVPRTRTERTSGRTFALHGAGAARGARDVARCPDRCTPPFNAPVYLRAGGATHFFALRLSFAGLHVVVVRWLILAGGRSRTVHRAPRNLLLRAHLRARLYHA